MDTQTEIVIEKAKRGTRGRKDSEGQEAVIKLDKARAKIDYLIKLHTTASEAKHDYSEAIKVSAEEAGILAAVLSKYVKARAGEKFEAEKTEVIQLSLIFGVED
jgi:hypothetical protein